MSRKQLLAAAGAGLLAFAPASADDAPAATAAEGVYSQAQAERGLVVYEARCMMCHAKNMTGGGAGSPPLIGRIFRIGWERETVGALFDYLKTTMPTGQAGSLTDQEYADVLAAMLAANGYPASADGAELTADAEALAGVVLGPAP